MQSDLRRFSPRSIFLPIDMEQAAARVVLESYFLSPHLGYAPENTPMLFLLSDLVETDAERILALSLIDRALSVGKYSFEEKKLLDNRREFLSGCRPWDPTL